MALDSDAESSEVGLLPDAVNTPAWSVIGTPRQFDLPLARAVQNKRSIDNVSLSMNRYLLTHALIQRRKVEPNPLLLQPWDKPTFLSSTFNAMFRRSDSVVSMPNVINAESTSQPCNPVRPRVTYAASVLCRQSYAQHEDLLRRKALIRWRIMVESDISTTSVGQQAEREVNDGSVSYSINDVLNDIFSRKSTATLLKRSSDLMRYSNWCISYGYFTPWRLQENMVYSYLQELKATSAPSTASSFISALRFAKHTIGLHLVDQVLSSRVCGAAELMLKNRRTVKQAKPLSVQQVFKLEGIAINHPDDKIRYIAGYLCFCLYSCARFKDAMYAESWTLDMPSPVFGYIEARTKKHKTANMSKRALMLPLVGFSCGLQNKSWGDVWFSLRDRLESELDDGFSVPYILPAILRNNLWANRPMTTSEGSIFLRELLRNEGEKVEGISTHSLKATLLSWASKGQMTIDDRRLLGHHVDKNQISPLTYSRDALAGPLERLWSILIKIKKGQFDPDESRATRAIKAFQSNGMPLIQHSDTGTGEQVPGGETEGATEIPIPLALEDMSTAHDMNESGVATEIPIPLTSEDAPVGNDTNELEPFSSDSSSEGSNESVSDVSNDNDCECEEAMLKPLRIVQDDPQSDPNIWIHKESGLGHVLRDEEGLRFACGKPRTPSYRIATNFTFSVSMCLRCRPIEAQTSTAMGSGSVET